MGINKDDNFSPFYTDERNRRRLMKPSDWLEISAGQQTSNMNNGRWNMRRYAPWYNDKADYNTNAKSYYDYLSRLDYLLDTYRYAINQLLRREIITGETNTIKMLQDGNWESEDDITLTSNAKLSSQLHQYTDHGGTYNYPNALTVDGWNGLWSKDFTNEINDIWDHIHQNEADIRNIYRILSGEWTRFGDFTIKTMNGFQAVGEKPVYVHYQKLHEGYNIQIMVTTVHGTITSPSLANVELGHGDKSKDKSYIFGVNLGGMFANIDWSTMTNVTQTGNAIWNITGGGNKWSAYIDAFPKVAGNDVTVAIQSYANGDNRLPGDALGSSNMVIQFYVKAPLD